MQVERRVGGMTGRGPCFDTTSGPTAYCDVWSLVHTRSDGAHTLATASGLPFMEALSMDFAKHDWSSWHEVSSRGRTGGGSPWSCVELAVLFELLSDGAGSGASYSSRRRRFCWVRTRAECNGLSARGDAKERLYVVARECSPEGRACLLLVPLVDS